jgi:ATP-dependent RNA helicase DeaD
VQPGNLVGAIANEADLDGSQINGIDIQDDHSFVRLPAGMPAQVLERLSQVRVKGRALAATPVERRAASRPGKPKPHRRLAKKA